MSAQKKPSDDESLLHPHWAGKVRVLELDQHDENLATKKAIWIGQGLSPADIIKLVPKARHFHIVQKNTINFDAELNSAALMSVAPERFFEAPLSSILSPASSGQEMEAKLTLLEITLNKLDEKNANLQLIETTLASMALSQTLMSDVLSICDELVTNAILHGPEKASSDLPRPQLIIGSDGERLVVACKDPYGLLDVNRLAEIIKSCYVNGLRESMNMGRGGAGIGSFMVFDSSASYYLAVDTGCTTLVCATLPIISSFKRRSIIPKNIHLFHNHLRSQK